MSVEEPIEARRVAHTMKGTIARSTFIAGFGYYEIGRNDFQKDFDAAYVSLMTMAFMFAVIAVGTGTLGLYFLDRSRSPLQKINFVRDANNTYIRGCFRAFLLALLAYILGLARSGFVYYANNNARWFVMALGLALVPIAFVGLVMIVRAQLKLQTNAGVPEGMVELLDPQEILRRAGGYDGRSFDNIHTRMMKEANSVADRAIYITGFCQSGVTRFISTDHPVGYVFIVGVALAFAAAMLSAFVLSVEAIFVFDTELDKQAAVAVLLTPLHNCLVVCYGVAFAAMCLTLAVMGWGCGYPDEAWVTLMCGLTALVLLAAGAYVTRRNALATKALKENDMEAVNTRSTDFIVALMNNTGSQATISSGFVFYNVVTFGTDVLPIKRTGYDEKVAFLIVCAVTLATGLVASGYDSMLTLALTNIESAAKRSHFMKLSSGMVSTCVLMYQLSMVAFLIGFGMFGTVKFPERSYVPMATAVGAAVLILIGWITINVTRRRAAVDTLSSVSAAAANGDGTAQSAAASAAASKLDDASIDARVQNRIKRQNMMSSRALFFGGFAYFAMCFFQQRNRSFTDQLYLVPMSLTFTISVVVIIWAAVYSVNNEECATAAQRYRFLTLCSPLYYAHILLSMIATVSFPFAFAVIGWQKSQKNYMDCAPMMLAGTCVLATLLPFALGRILTLGRGGGDDATASPSMSTATRSTKEPGADADAEATAIVNNSVTEGEFVVEDPQRFLAQVEVSASQSAFIAGNVFYEILFAASNGPQWVCNIYFIASTLTFISGCAVIGIATGIAFVVAKIKSDDELAKRRFIADLKRLRVKQLLLLLNCVCVFSWLTALSVLGATKYQLLHNLWEPSLTCGIVGALVLAYSLVRLRTISNGVLGK